VRRSRAVLLLCVAAAGLSWPGCGKKGPPLAPIVRAPGRAMDVKARRAGDTVTLSFTAPSANIDDTRPADLARLEVYAYTAMAQNDVRDIKRMTLVASTPVRKPPEREAKPAGEPVQPEAGRPASAAPAARPEPGVDQGALVTAAETLTDAMAAPLDPDGKSKKPVAPVEPPVWFDPPPPPPLGGPPAAATPNRYYVVYGVSRSGTRGGASPRPAVPLVPPPPPPEMPALTVAEEGVVVSWSVPPGARLPYQEPAGEGVLAATSIGMEPAPALSYVVSAGPTRLTDPPAKALTWTDTTAAYGVERCYDVRAVLVRGITALESGPSPAACVTPRDTFPPPAPSGLAAVAGEGAISLIWAGVSAHDLAGYVVLRAEAGRGEPEPLFTEPVKETTYRDGTARPGIRYVYAVAAVDTAKPANRSALSNTVEETAR